MMSKFSDYTTSPETCDPLVRVRTIESSLLEWRVWTVQRRGGCTGVVGVRFNADVAVLKQELLQRSRNVRIGTTTLLEVVAQKICFDAAIVVAFMRPVVFLPALTADHGAHQQSGR